jgi:hypothetical protein
MYERVTKGQCERTEIDWEEDDGAAFVAIAVALLSSSLFNEEEKEEEEEALKSSNIEWRVNCEVTVFGLTKVSPCFNAK